jgi:HSP20 family protein
MADIVRWEPTRDLTSLRSAMDRLFEESFIRPGAMGSGLLAAEMLPVDVIESDDKVVVQATVPGVKPEDIEVTLTGDLLTIKGEFKSEIREEKANYLRQERRMGSFSRRIGLPAGIDADKVEASFENGVLTLEMPKRESAKVKTVQVTTK